MALGRALAHTGICPVLSDLQLVPRLFLALWSPGNRRAIGPGEGQTLQTSRSSEGPEAGVSWPPLQRSSHLAMVVGVVPHQFLDRRPGRRERCGCSELMGPVSPAPSL